jgi:hypothetical protein
VSKFVNHSNTAGSRASLIEYLIEYFDRHVEMLINEGVPPDRIAEALRLTTIRVEILYGGGTCEDRQASRSQTLRRSAVMAARSG